MLELIDAYGVWLLLGVLFILMLRVRAPSNCRAMPHRGDRREGGMDRVRDAEHKIGDRVWGEAVAATTLARHRQEGRVDGAPMTGTSDGASIGCERRRLLHQLCRWALPAAFLLGVLALWLGGTASIGLALVGLILVLCPLVCVFLLFWEWRESKRVIAATEALRDQRGHDRDVIGAEGLVNSGTQADGRVQGWSVSESRLAHAPNTERPVAAGQIAEGSEDLPGGKCDDSH